MDTLHFLQRVLPTDGFYVTTVINAGQPPRQGFFISVDDLAKAVVASDQRGNNTYFAISSFVEKGSRKQDNVRATRVLVLDVDCGEGKPFPSWKEGLLALGRFVIATGLPKPMVVHSGNGLHVYWVLSADLAPQQWRPLANALKTAAKDKGFEVDTAVPADSARVLRPVGTTNPKNGVRVRLLVDTVPAAVKVIAAALDAYLVGPQILPADRRQATNSASALAQALVVVADFPPAVGAVVMVKCQQINWGVKNQVSVNEPFWYGMLGVAAYCTEPEEVAIAWSENHPGYNADTTLRKLNQWKSATIGPTTCSKFNELRPGGCKGCKYKDKIGSPARLGVQYTEVAPAQDAPQHVATDIPMPRGFKRTAKGIVLTVDDTDIDVTPFDLYPVSYGQDESLGYEVVLFHWYRQHKGWQELVMRQADLTKPRIKDFTTNIADQGIVLTSERQTEYFQIMLRSYMDELRQKRAMTNLYATMGWKENFSQFVIGDTVLRREADGSVSQASVSLTSATARMGHELWGTAGSRDAWVNFTSLVAKADLRAHMFALAVGFSAPLYAFTGLKGLTVSLYGPTGGGKSLAQMWVQSIYGDPERLHFAAKFTQNTLFSRMGLYSHMPMTIDEVTLMADMEVGDFLYWVSQGRDKARLDRRAEEREAKTWAMPVIVSTNKSMNSKLIASGLDTDAQIARILEVSVPSSSLFTRNSTAGRRIYEFITNNYGHVGREFVTRLLEMGEAGVRAAIAEATSSFQARHKSHFSGEERFWEQALVLADLAARMAKDWGLIAFDHGAGIEWVLAQLGSIRRSVAEFKIDAFDLLSEYLNQMAKAQVRIFHTGSQKPVMDHTLIPQGEIRVRFDLYRKTSTEVITRGVLMVDRVHFRKWLSTRGADYRSFMTDLAGEGIIVTPKTNKAYLAKNTHLKLGQSYVIGINLKHPRLQDILTDGDQAIDDLIYNQLKVVVP
ncbi:MAG: hypothetical protein DDT20_01431 [Firmicutes bacterium]|nr:hypothetical protein [Bacillota bacterium]